MRDEVFDVLRDKFRGAMLGVAIGDAIGSQFSGWGSVSRKTFEGREGDPGRLVYTAETHLAIGVAESLISCRGFEAEYMVRRLFRNYLDQPRCYPPRLRACFERMRDDVRWDEVTRAVGGTDGLNAPASRVVPAALFAHPDPAGVVRLAAAVAGMTDPCGWPHESANLLALAVALLVPMAPVRRLNKAVYLRSLRLYLHDPTTRRVLDCVEGLLPDSPPERVMEHLREVVPAQHAVPVALYAFLRCPESFHETVYHAVSAGGESGTTGAAAGALAGAFVGERLIPPVWRREVEGAPLIQWLADSLVTALVGTTACGVPDEDR